MATTIQMGVFMKNWHCSKEQVPRLQTNTTLESSVKKGGLYFSAREIIIGNSVYQKIHVEI